MLILIAEDDLVSMTLLSALLEKSGHQSINCFNGKEAWDYVSNNENPLPQACLIDWMMPVMDGITLVKEIRAQPRSANIPLIMVSAVSQQKKILEAETAGIDAYMTKPVRLTELHNLLNEHVKA